MANFLALTKPKIVLLLTLTALVGMMLTIEFYTNIFSSLASLLGFAFLAASSAALNQIFDRESDKNMERTKKRPLASGASSLTHAFTFTNEISLLPLILVLIIFLWTPPHFWPLAIDRLDEYKKEGVPMMPIAKGVSRTKKEMIVYSVLLLGASLAPFFYGLTGYFYLISTTALNLYFIYLCIAYLNDKENELSMKIFNFSVQYMLLFFLATYVDFLLKLYV